MSGIRSLGLRAIITRLCVASFLASGIGCILVLLLVPVAGPAVAWLAAVGCWVAALLVAHAVAGRLTQPLSDLVEQARLVARGETGRPAAVQPSFGEARVLAEAIDALGAKVDLEQARARRLAELLAELVAAVQASGGRLASASATLAEHAAAASHGASEQAAHAEHARVSVESLLVTSREIAVASEAAGLLADRTLLAAKVGETAVTHGIAGMEEAAATSRQAAERIVELSDLSRRASAIVDILDELADKSDLIALDAASGAQGDEAFAAAATGMRALAESVVESTGALKPLLTQVQRASAACALASEDHVRTIERATQDGARMGEHVRELLQLVVEMGDATRHVALTATRQRAGTEASIQAFSDLAVASRATKGAAARVTAATDDMARMASDLEAAASRFRADAAPGAEGAG